MTLWNIIRDFFVEFIFGGTLSTGEAVSDNFFGRFLVPTGNNYTMDTSTNTTWFNVGSHYINFGDWASTLATIVFMILVLVLFYCIARWLFRVASGLIRTK